MLFFTILLQLPFVNTYTLISFLGCVLLVGRGNPFLGPSCFRLRKSKSVMIKCMEIGQSIMNDAVTNSGIQRFGVWC